MHKYSTFCLKQAIHMILLKLRVFYTILFWQQFIQIPIFCFLGMIGVVWSVAWFFLVFDTPSSHPRITEEERNFIENAIEEHGGGKQQKPKKVPWKELLSSPPVWAIVICHGCSVFAYFTVVNQLPTYVSDVLHYPIKEVRFLSHI